MRLMIGAGGTGGHVYPALAVAETLWQHHPADEVIFVGTVGGGGFERRLVEESGLRFSAYVAVMAGPLVGVPPLRAVLSVIAIVLGTLQALGYLWRFRPGAILLTGGWANVPLSLAAWLMRVPMVVYLPDIEPGRTIQIISRFAKQVAITVDESAQYFRAGQAVVTGYPLRRQMMSATREAALEHFGLDATLKTLLVFGGSRGARSINLALADILPQLLAEDIQIIHVTGTHDWDEAQARLNDVARHPHYHAFAYLNEDMGLALAAADLVICRSGASILGELTYFGVASILVPYPYAWRYQKTNADYLASRGAAIHMADEHMAQQLLPTIRELWCDSNRLTQLSRQAKALAQPEGALQLVRVWRSSAEANVHG